MVYHGEAVALARRTGSTIPGLLRAPPLKTYPIPPYGIQSDAGAGLAVSYPGAPAGSGGR